LLRADELQQLPPLRWLVDDVLPADALAALVGPSGKGKTFLTIGLSGAVATKEQLIECERLATELEWAYEKQQEYLERAGCKSFRNLSQAQIADLIGKLEVRLADKKSKQS
jgi:DNA replication protein DnaC